MYKNSCNKKSKSIKNPKLQKLLIQKILKINIWRLQEIQIIKAITNNLNTGHLEWLVQMGQGVARLGPRRVEAQRAKTWVLTQPKPNPSKPAVTNAQNKGCL